MLITGQTIHQEDQQGSVAIQNPLGTSRVVITPGGSITLTGGVSVGGATDSVGFFGAATVAVQGATATSGTFTAGAGAAAVSGSSWVGNAGTKSYSVSDIVSALKAYGILSS